MADAVKKPSSFSLWLEEALPGWLLPVGGIAILGLAALLYMTGRLSEEATGAMLTVAVPLVAVLFLARATLDLAHAGGERALAVAAVVLVFAAAAVPAALTILPGKPLVEGELGQEGEKLPLPEGTSGRVRVLVSGKLQQTGDTLEFVLGGADRPMDGKLERNYASVRVGRSGRGRVAREHNTVYLSGTLPAGAPALSLDTVRGQLGSRLHVSVFRDRMPTEVAWILAAVALALAAVSDARLKLKGNAAIAGAIALAFGLLVAGNATPADAVGPAIGGTILGALVGALAGSAAAWIARKAVPAAGR